MRLGALLVALVVALTAGDMLPLAYGASAAAIDRPLLQFKLQHPHDDVDVIVQSRRATDASQAVQGAAGQVRMGLPFLGALAASVNADELDLLASQPGIVRIALDPVMQPVDGSKPDGTPEPVSVYPQTVGAPAAWRSGNIGGGVAIAVLDSGVQPNQDFGTPSRVIVDRRFNPRTLNTADQYGHGTWVAGIAAGAGSPTRGGYSGLAPGASIVDLKVSDDTGAARASNVMAALDWVIGNHAAYNIRVVNLSFVSSLAEGYATDLLDAAVEMVWHSGVVVVVSAGNRGPNSVQFAPANDPYVITVGASDDQATASPRDDTLAWFSSFGLTQDGFSKPEVVAPGRHIIGPLASTGATLATEFPNKVIDHQYIQLSGTSAATPVVSGSVALLLAARPGLTPDQVKWLLVQTAQPVQGSAAGEPDVAAALGHTANIARANVGLVPNRLVGLAYLAQTTQSRVSWDSVSWDSVSWDSVSWDSVSWDSVSWDSVSWDSSTSDTLLGAD